MKNDAAGLQQEILAVLDIARLSPSVHNTQPWLVDVRGAAIVVSIDKRYALTDGDPTHRQTVMSLGIFCEAIRLVALERGLAVKTLKFKGHAATIGFKTGKPTALPNTNQSASQLLRHRATDRSIYRPTDLTAHTVKTILTAAKGLKARVHVVNDESLIQAIAELTSHGIDVALSSPSFRKELSGYLVLPGSKKNRGIAVKSLYIPRILSYLEPSFMRFGKGLRTEVALEKRRWLSASAIVIITADGDLSKYWFEAGRAYLRASLLIEDQGLSQATSAAIVEASNYHEDVETMLHTNQRILSLIRVGKGSSRRHHSPRVSLDEIVTLS